MALEALATVKASLFLQVRTIKPCIANCTYNNINQVGFLQQDMMAQAQQCPPGLNDLTANTSDPAIAAASNPGSSHAPQTQASTAPEDDRTAQATLQAMKRLQSVLHKYMPLHREPGQHVFRGLDLVVHDHEEKPFKLIGYILMAAQMLEGWEKIVGETQKQRIRKLPLWLIHSCLTLPVVELDQLGGTKHTDSEQALNKSPVKIREIMDVTQPHKSPSQPIAHAITLPKREQKMEKWAVLGGGMVFIREQYLRRLELENGVYRRHLHALEQEIYSNTLENLADALGLQHVPDDVEVTGATQSTFNFASPQKSEERRDPSRTSGGERVDRVMNEVRSPDCKFWFKGSN